MAIGKVPTDLKEARALADVISADVMASGARTLPTIRKAARESLASLRPDLRVVVTIDHECGLYSIDIRDGV